MNETEKKHYISTVFALQASHLVINLSSSSPNSPPMSDGSPTTITSCEAKEKAPDAGAAAGLWLFFFEPLLPDDDGVEELGVEVDLRFRLVLGALVGSGAGGLFSTLVVSTSVFLILNPHWIYLYIPLNMKVTGCRTHKTQSPRGSGFH